MRNALLFPLAAVSVLIGGAALASADFGVSVRVGSHGYHGGYSSCGSRYYAPRVVHRPRVVVHKSHSYCGDPYYYHSPKVYYHTPKVYHRPVIVKHGYYPQRSYYGGHGYVKSHKVFRPSHRIHRSYYGCR